jgi:hypothetical protein
MIAKTALKHFKSWLTGARLLSAVPAFAQQGLRVAENHKGIEAAARSAGPL